MALPIAPIAAQECHICYSPAGCPRTEDHRDQCYIGFDWQGGCNPGADGQCQPSSCGVAHGYNCGAASIDLDDIPSLFQSANLDEVASEILQRRLEIDSDRAMLYLMGCDGAIVAQHPLTDRQVAVLEMAVSERRSSLLAELLQL